MRVRIQHRADIYTNALCIKERSLHRIYTHTYIYILKQRRKNEFWRHAPRGRTEGNTHHTHNRFVLSYAFSSLTRRLLFVAAVPHDEKKSNPSFFFLFFRARVYIGGVDLSSFSSEMIIPLSFCVPRSVREGDRVFQNARFVRERERERQTDDVVSDLPLKGKKRERRPTRLISHPTLETKCKERKKKTNRRSQNITYRRKKEKEREREKESVFLREKRDIFPPFSLSFLCLPRREERVEKQTDIFRITA